MKKRKGEKPRKMKNIQVGILSLVDKPANNLGVVVKELDDTRSSIVLNSKVVKSDVQKGVVYMTVFQPNEADLQNDWTDSEQLEKTAHDFLESGRQNKVDIQHNLITNAGTVVESSILGGDNDERYPGIKKGAWVVAVKLSDEAKKNIDKIKGCSLYGTCTYDDDADLPEDLTVQKANAVQLKSLRREKGLSENAMATSLGLSLEDYLKVEDGEADLEWTPQNIVGAAKACKMKPEEFAAFILTGASPAAPSDAQDPAPEDPAPEDPNASKNVDSPNNNQNGLNTQTQKSNMKKPVVKSVQNLTVDDGGEKKDRVVKTAEQIKAERYETVVKSLIDFKNGSDVVERVSKGGLITPDDFAPGGTLTAAQSDALIGLMVDQSAFLKQIQVKQMLSKKQEVTVWDIAGRKAKRFKSGFYSANEDNMEEGINKTLVMDANKINIEFTITDEVLSNYQGNLPGLEQEIINGFVGSFGNEILDIAFNCTADSTATQELTWANLGIGWFKLAQGNTNANLVIDISNEGVAADTIQEKMDLLIDRFIGENSRFDTGLQKLMMSKVDFRAFSKATASRADGIVAHIKGAEKEYAGYGIEPLSLVSSPNMMFTDPKNLVLGIVKGGDGNGFKLQRFAVPDGILFRATAYIDMAIVNMDGIAVVQA